MISAINSTNSPSFTSVVPIRVFIDGMETFDTKFIQKSCRQLSKVLAGPSKTEPNLSLIRKFAKFDPDYNLQKGYNGYPKEPHHKNIRPSNYFRLVTRNIGNFFLTGPQAELAKTSGKNIGQQKSVCNSRKVEDSFDLMFAKKDYKATLNRIIKNTKVRIKETFNPTTKERLGAPVNLHIKMKSNKKYGLSTFDIKLDDIEFC